MKERLYNNFCRILKNKKIAKLLADFFHGIIYLYYRFKRILVKKYVSEIKSSDAYRYISNIREKTISNPEIITLEMNKKVDLSVIIPAYNVEKYIEDCIKSVKNQATKYNIEIIIINDGSTDGTDDIIKRIDDERILYITQKNKGLSAARNTGLNHATGKYVLFVDSDDILEDNSIDMLMNEAANNNADIVVGGYYIFSNDNDKQYFVGERKEIENDPARAVQNIGFAWGKVCRRELFHHLRFPEGAWYEDTIICNVLYRMCRTMIVIDKPVCGYRINPKGISKTAGNSVKTLDHLWVLFDAIEQAHNNHLEDDDVAYALAKRHLSNLMYHRLRKLDDKIKENAFVTACCLLDDIRPVKLTIDESGVQRDLEEAFVNRNYKLWKLVSFII